MKRNGLGSMPLVLPDVTKLEGGVPMDWGRTKTILIISFFLLNVVLGFQLYTNRFDLIELGMNSESAIQETLKLLKAKEIELPTDLPKELPKLKEIVIRFDETLTGEQQQYLQTPFKFNPLINKGAIRDAVAHEGIPKLDSYAYDPYTSSNGTYMFHQLYNELPMFEVRLELYDQNGWITSYRQRYAEVQPDSGQKEQNVISPYVALRSLVEYYLPQGAVVTSVRLGYHGQEYNSQTMYMVPYWRVSLGSGEIYFVHAFNGAVE